MKKAIHFATIYAAISIVIGPLIAFTSSTHPSGWDCTDASWSDNVSIAQREAIYDHAARFMTPSASLMILIGLGILSYLIYSAIKGKRFSEAVGPAFLILFMIGGYSILIWVANSSWCS